MGGIFIALGHLAKKHPINALEMTLEMTLGYS
jgi:hypothetical protein